MKHPQAGNFQAAPTAPPRMKRSRRPRPGTARNPDTGLTAGEEAFAFLVALGGIAKSEAFRRANPHALHWSANSVHVSACRMAARPAVGQRIRDLSREACAAAGVTREMILEAFLLIAKADPRELSAIHVSPCRYCNGKDHQYQYTDGELVMECERWETRRADRMDRGLEDVGAFNPKGGDGFHAKAAPHPDCPSCGGKGKPHVVLADSRHYSPSALALFVGAVERDGRVEVIVIDRMRAIEALGRHFGLFVAARKADDNRALDTSVLDAIFAAAMSAAQQRHAATASERLLR